MARLGILAAMPSELAKLEEAVTDQQVHKLSDVFSFTTGTLENRHVVYGAANVGTVFAASAATLMIQRFDVKAVVFTGVAGGLLKGQNIGDIVVGEDVVNYDMDCRTFKYEWDPEYKIQLGELPFLKWLEYPADPELLELAKSAPPPDGAVLSVGRLATGSAFLDCARKEAMRETHWVHLKEPAACDMENAAVAQICRAFAVPYLSLRALSDIASGDAADDFNAFCQKAADNVFPIVCHVVRGYKGS